MSTDITKAEQIAKDIEGIELETLEPYIGQVQNQPSTMLLVTATTVGELKFLMSLINETNPRSITTVVPIEGVLKPIGKLVFNFDTLMKIKSYNPRISLKIKTNKQTKELTYEDIIML